MMLVYKLTKYKAYVWCGIFYYIIMVMYIN